MATKKTKDELVLEVDLDQLLIGDLEKLEDPGNTGEGIDMLDKLVTNVDIRTLPLSMLAEIRKAIKAQLAVLSADPNSEELSETTT